MEKGDHVTVVEPRLSGGEDEGDAPSSDALENGLQRLLSGVQLLEVSALELRPLVGLVVEPAPQFGGRSSLLGPEVDLRVLLRETAVP